MQVLVGRGKAVRFKTANSPDRLRCSKYRALLAVERSRNFHPPGVLDSQIKSPQGRPVKINYNRYFHFSLFVSSVLPLQLFVSNFLSLVFENVAQLVRENHYCNGMRIL